MKMTSHGKMTIALFLGSGAVLFLLATWFSMSTVEYSSAEGQFHPSWAVSFRRTAVEYSSAEGQFHLYTAGWFFLGFIFLVPTSLGFAGIFLLLSRWVGLRVAWSSMLLIGLVLVGHAVRSALPINRLKPVIGDRAAAAASIELLSVRDSFNEGMFYAGVLSGESNLMSLIEQYRPLQKSKVQMPLIRFREIFRDVDLPDETEVYSDAHGSFFADADGKRVFFWHAPRRFSRQNGEQSPTGDVRKAAQEK